MDRSIFYGARGMNQSSTWTPPILSSLSALTTSDTTQTVIVVVTGIAGDGNSFEYSTDGVNYSEKGTSATGTYNATGLTAGTLYYWRARPYKGAKYGEYSNVASDTTSAEITDGNILKYYSNGITAGYISGDHLTGLNDLSGQNNHASKAVVADEVHLVTNGFGTNKVIRLGGNTKSYMHFTEITTARSFIWIGLENTVVDDVLAPLFGSDATYYQNGRMTIANPWVGGALNSRGIFDFVAGGVNTANFKWVRQNIRVNGKKVSAHGTDVPTSMSIITGTNSEAFRLNNLAMDRVPSRVFGGDLILFKIFDKVLSEDELKSEIIHWGSTFGINVSISGISHTVHMEGDSFVANGGATWGNNGIWDIAPNFPISGTIANTAVAGSKIESIIARSDNNTIPNQAFTDIIINCGINDCGTYYTNSVAQQRSDFAGRLESMYQKLKTKNQFNHLFLGNTVTICEAQSAVLQATIDAIPYHYIYNEEFAVLAANHSDVHIVPVNTILDGTITADYTTDGIHPSAQGLDKLWKGYLSVINSIYT